MKYIIVRFLLLGSLLFTLPGCLPSIAINQSATAVPLPLTGARASKLGAAVLTVQTAHLAKDGDTVDLVPLAAANGQPLAGYAPIEMGSGYQAGFSPDREELAFVGYGTANCPANCFHLVDLRNWQEILTPVQVDPMLHTWTSSIVFDASGQRAAFALNDQSTPDSQLVVIDVTQAKEIAHVQLDHSVFNLHFTPSGDLAVYGPIPVNTPGVPTPAPGFPDAVIQGPYMSVTLLDAATLKARWQHSLPEAAYSGMESGDPRDPTKGRYLNPGVAFAPDGGKLYILSADSPRLITVDFTRRLVTSQAIQPRRSLFDRVMAFGAGVAYAKTLNGVTKTAVISPDGQRLYVVGQSTTAVKKSDGNYDMERQSLGLQVIDPASATELAHLDTQATDLSIAPDGKTIFLVSWPQSDTPNGYPNTDVLDASTLKIIQTLPGQVQPTRLLNGQQAWLSMEYFSSSDPHLAIYTPGQDTPRAQWKTSDSYAGWVPVP